MSNNKNLHRINAYISVKNYDSISELMNNEKLISMRMSKGVIIDLALTNLFKSLECGETLEALAIQHLEGYEGGA